jgi:hypothetical protein
MVPVINDMCIADFSLESFEFKILPAEMGLASNDVGPMPSKDEPCTFTLPLDLAAEDLVLDV